jgi:uncharacterized protein (UPF0548 family)
MAFSVRKPHSILQKVSALESSFSYADHGMTRDPGDIIAAELAQKYRNIDHYEVLLGTGEAVFAQAKDAISTWRHFPAWVEIVYPYASLEEGRAVGILARVLGLYSLNFCRIVYIVDEPTRFGFGYGTISPHEERGEERFLIEKRDDDAVTYSILAISSPQSFMARVGYPMARRMQRRFGRDSLATMKGIVTTVV